MKSGKQFTRVILAIGILSTGTLTFETALTRFLAIAQFYHFAFLIVSLALLGFGASGTLLSLFPFLKKQPLPKILSRVGVGFAISIWITYGVVNWLPFDSYSIAWEKQQLLYLFLYFFSLTLPFLVSGLGLGIALAVVDSKHNLVYAASLVGSALGVILAPAALSLSGILGVILLCGLLGIGSSLCLRFSPPGTKVSKIGLTFVMLVSLAGFCLLTYLNFQGRSPLGIELSPYKGLAYARNKPDSKTIFGKWNAISRVDILTGAGTRRLPGLSYMHSGSPPQQYGLSVDGEALQPITLTSPADFAAASWLPEWWAFKVHVSPEVLVLNPGAGLGILQALSANSGSVSTVIDNRLILESVRATAPSHSFFDHPDVLVYPGNSRAFLQNTNHSYDLIYLPLTDSYQPVTNGVYSISENFTLTAEGFQAGLSRLREDGVLVCTRWLQNPPSESLRLVSTILQALESEDMEKPQDAFVIYRGIQTLTVVVKPGGWQNRELSSLREFLDQRRFDLVWAPDLELDELNRWNQLTEPIYHQTITGVFQAQDDEVFYDSYPFNIRPAVDNQPFFFHFFTWRQAPEVLETLGKTWQPFGGSGFFLLVILLILVILLSALMIFLPLTPRHKMWLADGSVGGYWVLVYFGLIGIGFMFLEIPLISQWSLFLSTPIAAFSVVVGAILFYSGLGSMASDHAWWQRKGILFLFAGLGGGFILTGYVGKELLLGWPVWIRYLVPCVGLAPVGFLMGTFFPRGISWIKGSIPDMVAWAWAINGSFSVIASVSTALLSLQFGFFLVMLLGGLAYLGAWMVYHLWMS